MMIKHVVALIWGRTHIAAVRLRVARGTHIAVHLDEGGGGTYHNVLLVVGPGHFTVLIG